jgi:hypothetical protein
MMGSVLGPSAASADFDQGELAALSALADAGLVPRLRWSSHRVAITVTNITPVQSNPNRLRANATAIAR